MNHVITTTLNAIREAKPCSDGWEKLLRHLGKTKADDVPLPLSVVLDSNGLNDCLWCLRTRPDLSPLWRLYAVWCARQVQHLMDDERSRAALDVAERHGHGQASNEELHDAREAAWAAAWAATGAAARAAARDAADAAAREAAWAAARAAARDAAWTAARDAVGAASRNAAWAAVGAASRNAAWAAVGAAARDAARDAAWAAVGAASRNAAWAAADAAARAAADAAAWESQAQMLRRLLDSGDAEVLKQ